MFDYFFRFPTDNDAYDSDVYCSTNPCTSMQLIQLVVEEPIYSDDGLIVSGCTIDSMSWLQVMSQELIDSFLSHPNFVFCLQRPPTETPASACVVAGSLDGIVGSFQPAIMGSGYIW